MNKDKNYINWTTRIRSSSRPWYRAAIEQNSLVWSPIYLFADPPVLGITPAIPLKDTVTNNIKGVMAIDLTLDEISKFLNSLKISSSGRALLLKNLGRWWRLRLIILW